MSRPLFQIRLHGEDARVVIDGEDITNKVSSVWVGAGVSLPTTVWLEFPAVDVEIDGEGEIKP